VLVLLTGTLPVHACDYPDEGNMPLRRAVARVQYLPETEAWSKQHRRNVLYLLKLEETVRVAGRCYWTLEAVGNGAVWQRFYVSPDGKSVLAQGRQGLPLTLRAWREKE
jgi:hypothetical protein